MREISNSDFYIVAHEAGAEHPAIPTWASKIENPAGLEPSLENNFQRVDIESVPGAFQLTGIASLQECQQLICLSESLGYLQDAAVSLPRSVRHNDSFTWVVDRQTNDILWRRCCNLVNHDLTRFNNKKALGLNARFRFYRYKAGDYFSPHTDGSWPGSEVVNGELLHNAYDDRWSQLTLLLFLSDNYDGGRTQFYLDPDCPGKPASNPEQSRIASVQTAAGSALCFPHGLHPLHCLHGSEPLVSGCKYIIRSDVLFEL